MSSTWTAGSDGKGPRRGRWPSRARSPSSGVRIRIDGDVMMPVCRVRNPLVKSCVSAGKSRLDQERGNSCNSHSNDTAHVHGPVPKIRWTTPAIDAPSRRKHNRCASGWQLGVPSICPAVVQRAQLSSSPLSMPLGTSGCRGRASRYTCTNMGIAAGVGGPGHSRIWHAGPEARNCFRRQEPSASSG